VGGGLSAHEGLLQAVADLSGSTFEVSAEPEATARGIGALAGEAAGLLDGTAAAPGVVRRVVPSLAAADRARERERWREAVEIHMRAQA
jgi:glycerol kinase